MKRIRVVHLIDYMGLGGAEMMLYRLLARMDRALFESTVISMMPLGKVGEQVARLNVGLHVLGMLRGQPSARAFLRLIRLLRWLDPDVLQTWMVNADLAGLLAGRIAGVPSIVWNIRDSKLQPGECSRTTAMAKHACARLSCWPIAVVANAEAGRRAHEAIGYRPRAWWIIPNGFDLEAFAPDLATQVAMRAELGVPPDAPLIGIVGRYHPMKDHATFLKAAQRLHARRPEAHFAMAGSDLTPNNRALTDIAPQLVSSGTLHLLGARHDIPRLLAALDVFTLTSHSEGFPNVVGEAMACGVPCVVVESAGDASTIVGETGLVVPTKDPDALEAAWVRLLSLPTDQRKALGEAARERVRAKYALDLIVQQYTQLYESISREAGLGDSLLPSRLAAAKHTIPNLT
jgi:glycosyltransferase involved in cell wall biosynthesis